MAVSLILLPAGFQWRICARAGSSSTMLISRLTFWRRKRKSFVSKSRRWTGPLDITIDLGKDRGTKVIYFESPFVEKTMRWKRNCNCSLNQLFITTATAVTLEDGFNAWVWRIRLWKNYMLQLKMMLELKQRSLKFNGTVFENLNSAPDSSVLTFKIS